MKDTFALITNIITLIVFFGTIIFAIANAIWKKQCEKKYKISADFFTYPNKTGVLFRAAIIILLNITILSTIYLNYKDSIYTFEVKGKFKPNLNMQEIIGKNTDQSNIKYNLMHIKGNIYYLNDVNALSEIISDKIKSIDDKSKPEEGYKRLRFEYSIDSAKDNNKTKVFMLQVQDNVKISDIINFVDQHKKLEGLSVKPGYYVSWMLDNNIEVNTLDKPIKEYKNDDITLKAQKKIIKDIYHVIRINKDSLLVFKNTSLSWLTLICIILYIFVISIGIYLYYVKMVKKNNKKIISKKLNHLYMLTLLASNAFSCCIMLFYNRNYSLYSKNNLIISSIIIITLAFSFISFLCKNKVKKEHCIYIFCILLGMIITFYTLSFLDIIIYILFNFYLLDIIADVIIQTLVVMIGLVIIVLSYANLFINSIILDLEPKYKLIHINNKNNYLDIPEDLAVISEYKNKFLAVRYKAEEDELIKLYTDEYWFIDPSDCIVKEESFKKELVVKGNDKLKLSTLDAIIRAEKNNIEELKYSREPIILYSNVETDKKPNIPKKDRHGLIINEDDYKIFKFKSLLSDDKNSELSDNALKEYNMCLIKKGFKLEDINNEMLGLDTEYVLWYLRYKNKFWIKKDTVNAYFVKNGLEILINEDNENEPLPICFKLLIAIKDNTVKAYLIEKYMDIKTVCELLNITERDIVIIENYESNNVIAQIVDKEKDILNNNAIDKDTKTHHTENNQSQNKSQDDNIK